MSDKIFVRPPSDGDHALRVETVLYIATGGRPMPVPPELVPEFLAAGWRVDTSAATAKSEETK
jgi:hypothetical protein